MRNIIGKLLVELRYRQDAGTAIVQIQRQKYPARLEHYRGNLILVGISYDREVAPKRPNFKHHSLLPAAQSLTVGCCQGTCYRRGRRLVKAGQRP